MIVSKFKQRFHGEKTCKCRDSNPWPFGSLCLVPAPFPFGAFQPLSVQPTLALSGGQYSVGSLQLEEVINELSRRQSRLFQSLERIAVHLLDLQTPVTKSGICLSICSLFL